MVRAGLTREKVALAGLELIDEIGLDAFSMRKLGNRLGVDPMAAYRHIRDREALFDAIAELLFAEADPETLPWDEGWRALAREYCTRLRRVLLRHPQAVFVFATRPVRSSEAIATGVRMIEVFAAAGFTPADGLRIARSLRELTIGHALSLSAVELGSQTRSRKPQRGAPNYNVLAASADETRIDDHFELALRAMIDGFERLLQPGAD
ncbi:MAG TPA: TetR/AcrR family transcriptional regulator C-terminal domain-containing protein [Candidatus Ruania gallistercoris]|uniref:TetR/AcrR family transcriptional regulator C-terminal domain-containing protein n=1 Tax=Candidatus Ruania gallistercoris TaxID=2838746 RepID=A0A9D2EGF8_9MICO|nr:TetR/AcrR family transcriptional regulator C-terminal domain-containing protein [Candidatus Ruania gallistercoris]